MSYSRALGSQRPKGISDILHSLDLPTTGYHLKLTMPLFVGSGRSKRIVFQNNDFIKLHLRSLSYFAKKPKQTLEANGFRVLDCSLHNLY